MGDLNYDLKQLCRGNCEGSYATRADREHTLNLITDQLDGMGFRHMNAQSLKPKHVEKLVERWLAENLSPGTIKNRMSALRWWAQKTGKENIVARSNAAYDIPDRVYVTNVSKARELAVKAIEDTRTCSVSAGSRSSSSAPKPGTKRSSAPAFRISAGTIFGTAGRRGTYQYGTPLFALQELGSWQSPEMVLRFAHLAADHLAPYAEHLGAVRAVPVENEGTNTAQR
jgi:hypothetical protein